MSAETASSEPEEICGESYDHRLELLDERDGMRTYECRECGAELWEDDEQARASLGGDD